MIRLLVGAIGLSVLATTNVLAADPVEIGIGYLRRVAVKPTLSLVEQPAENDGVAGARLAIEDNNTTGKFLNQHFTLEEVRLKDGDDAAKAAIALADRTLVLSRAPARILFTDAERCVMIVIPSPRERPRRTVVGIAECRGRRPAPRPPPSGAQSSRCR